MKRLESAFLAATVAGDAIPVVAELSHFYEPISATIAPTIIRALIIIDFVSIITLFQAFKRHSVPATFDLSHLTIRAYIIIKVVPVVAMFPMIYNPVSAFPRDGGP